MNPLFPAQQSAGSRCQETRSFNSGSEIRNSETERSLLSPAASENAAGANATRLKPLVIGAPRSGFSLLIAVINAILRLPNGRRPGPGANRVLEGLTDLTSRYLTLKYQQTFARFGRTNDLVFNGEFHRLVGGPKWLEPKNPRLACFRKYFGIKGQGDFLLVTSHPREVMEVYPTVHSHTAPALWLREPYYDSFQKFASLRNPIGVINSACFSLNAMASEYLQRFMPNESEDLIRQRHGLYKLTDLDFVRGLVKFLKTYLDEFLPVRGRYFVMKWEDLITRPAETIRRIAAELGVSLSAGAAAALWKPMDHVNLLQYHRHNYRRGKGIVGDWKNSLVNEHMAIFREHGFDTYLKALDYPAVPDLNPRDYSPYQKLVAAHLQRGEVFRNTGDPDLFGFAFNKSNIDASKFSFKAFPKRKWTQVERSTVPDDALVQAVSDTAEESCEKINGIIGEFFGADRETADWTPARLSALEKECAALMRETGDAEGQVQCERTFRTWREGVNRP